MRLTKSLFWRAIIACGIAGAAGVLSVVIVIIVSFRGPAPRLAEVSWELLLQGRFGDVCEEAAEERMWSDDGMHIAFAAADELPGLLTSLDVNERILTSADGSRGFGARLRTDGGEFLLRLDRDDGCRYYLVKWPPLPGFGTGALTTVLVMLVISGTGGIMMGMLWVSRPTLRRLDSLAERARAVGSAEYEPLSGEPVDEIGDVGQVLETAHYRIVRDRDALLARETALRRHLSEVAHDVGTPLTSLFIVLERMHERAGDPETAAEITGALTDVVYVSSLTRNLSLRTLFEDNDARVDLEAIAELGSVLDRVAHRYRRIASGRGTQIDIARPDEEVWVGTDPTAVEQAVSNVVENSVLYAGQQAQITLVLEVDAGQFRLEISDDGEGVAGALVERLSEPGFRAEPARQRRPTGSGLGLSITSEVARRAGWDLSIASAPGEGFAITITGGVLEDPRSRRGTGRQPIVDTDTISRLSNAYNS